MTASSDTGPTFTYRLKPIARLGRWASGLIGGIGVMSALTGIGYAYYLYLLVQIESNELSFFDSAFELAELWNGIIAVGYLLFLTGGMIVYLFWVYRAAANVHAVRPHAMTIRPGWAVGWNFIPIALFWKPYQAVRQIWQASHDIQYLERVEVPVIFGWWWGCWLASLFIDRFIGFDVIDLEFENLSALKWESAAFIASSAAFTPACYFLFKIIREITRVQKTLASNTAGIFE
jgi:hypothetical protein